MTRLTTLKISLFSALATLFLLVAMLASTGTASAHAASKQATAYPHPQIEVTDVVQMGGNCEEINLVGYGFFPGHVQLEAFQQGYSASVQPAFFKTNGSFSREVTICGDFGWNYGLGWGPGYGWYHHHHHGWGLGYGWGYAPTVLFAIGPLGLQSNSVTLQ